MVPLGEEDISGGRLNCKPRAMLTSPRSLPLTWISTAG